MFPDVSALGSPMRPETNKRALWAWGAALWLLLTSVAHAAAPAGQWWNTAYNYRMMVTIPAGTTALPTDYAVSVVFNHSAQVTAGRSLASGNDVRVVRWTGSGWVELDRVLDPDTTWNTTTSRIWFDTAQSIAANASNTDYYIYYNNPAAGTPPQTGENVFLLYDDFSGSNLNTSRWTRTGSAGVSGGIVELNPNDALQATSSYSFGVDTIWETRARMTSTYGDFQYWGGTATIIFFEVYLRFQSTDTAHQALANDLDFVNPSIKGFAPVTPTSFQLYAFTREGSSLARYLINGTQVASNNTGVPTSNLRARMENNQGGQRLQYDWARIRPYRNPDPTLSLAAAEARVTGVNKFVMAHDRAGINCLAETIVVNARDASNNAVTTYTQNVTLNTGTGKGTWTKTTGSGTFTDATANDGLATYQWPSGESSATFALYYPEGTATFDIDAYQTDNTALRDDDTEGTITFSPNGFTVTSALLTNPASIPAFTSPQTAGTPFNIHITAYGQTPTDPLCGIIEAYNGSKTLQFSTSYVTPTSPSVAMTIGGSSLPTNGSAASQSLTFTNGQASVSAKYKDVGRVAVNVQDTTGSPVISGGTGNIVVKPATFVISVASVPSPAPTGATSAKFVAAGAPFSVTVRARDAEGSDTPSYGKESPAQSIELLPTLVAVTGGGTTNPAVVAVSGTPTFNAGVSTWNFSWPEVGIITLTPHVLGGQYLGTVDVTGAASGNVGRFYPNAFTLSANIPVLQTGCSPSSPYSGFTYIGQPLSFSVAPQVTATAVAVGGTTTRNYMGPYFKLSSTSVSTRNYAPVGSAFTVTQAVPPPATVTDLTNGLGRVLLSATSGVTIVRDTPRAPFNAPMTLTMNLTDSDSVTAASNLVIGDPVNGISFSTSAEQRYGRVAFRNAIGSELLPLALPLRAEYFASATAGFVRNRDDVCTNTVSVSLSTAAGNLATTDTCVLDSGQPGSSGAGCSTAATSSQRFQNPPTALAGASPPDGGDFNLWLQAPGATNDGTLTLIGNAPSWLQFDWDASTPGVVENPRGTATFGVYQGSSRRIYQRERVR